MERGSLGILSCIDYHGSSSRGKITTSEKWLYIKNKMHNTKMQLKSNKLLCTELYSCGTEDESCIKLMLDVQSIDEDSCKSFTDDM